MAKDPIMGHHGDRIQYECIECGVKESFAGDSLMQTHRAAIMYGKWKIAGYKTPGNGGNAPKMLPLWHCVTCALVVEEMFNQERASKIDG